MPVAGGRLRPARRTPPPTAPGRRASARGRVDDVVDRSVGREDHRPSAHLGSDRRDRIGGVRGGDEVDARAVSGVDDEQTLADEGVGRWAGFRSVVHYARHVRDRPQRLLSEVVGHGRTPRLPSVLVHPGPRRFDRDVREVVPPIPVHGKDNRRCPSRGDAAGDDSTSENPFVIRDSHRWLQAPQMAIARFTVPVQWGVVVTNALLLGGIDLSGLGHFTASRRASAQCASVMAW